MGVPDARPTMSETRRRLNLVERAMHERGWSTALARALAKQMGVDVRSVYRWSIVGLGRDWKWKDLIDADERQQKLFRQPIEQTCGFHDG